MTLVVQKSFKFRVRLSDDKYKPQNNKIRRHKIIKLGVAYSCMHLSYVDLDKSIKQLTAVYILRKDSKSKAKYCLKNSVVARRAL